MLDSAETNNKAAELMIAELTMKETALVMQPKGEQFKEAQLETLLLIFREKKPSIFCS